MRIGVLTSSRADYGIYRPLLRALKADPFFDLSIIAFGTHLSAYHGRSVNNILEDGFEVNYTVNSMLLTDDENSVATAVALTAMKFAEFWKNHSSDFDLVICLGDRYEVFAAVISGIPFQIPFAHIHGGETTLGAIDNIYRHSITLSSVLHFTATEAYAQRVKAVLGHDRGVWVCGALGLDNIREVRLFSIAEFREKWGIDLTVPSILITVHPETVKAEQNKRFVQEIEIVLAELVQRYQLIITMPNADTLGSLWRGLFQQMAQRYPERAFAVENFGTAGYFSAMKHCLFLMGNSSSGIIEAASLGKYVIDLGDRQKGRMAGDNVIHVPFHADEILETVKRIETRGDFTGENPYYKGGAVTIILNALKSYFHTLKEMSF